MVKQARTLRQWRLDVYAMRQDEFAAKLGVNLSTLRTWEQGVYRPRPDAHKRIAAALGLEPQQILFPETRAPKARAA